MSKNKYFVVLSILGCLWTSCTDASSSNDGTESNNNICIQHPSDTQLYVSTSDQPTLQVYGTMYKEDITGHGENPKIKAQVGYGDTLEPKNYTWPDASFNKSEGNNIGDRAMAVSSPMRHKRIRLAVRAIGRGRYALLRVAICREGVVPPNKYATRRGRAT